MATRLTGYCSGWDLLRPVALMESITIELEK